MTAVDTRPTPLRDVASFWGKVHGVLTGLVTGALSAGVIGAGQADTINAAFTAADLAISAGLGLFTAIVTAWTAHQTARSGEAKVTPVEDPRMVLPGGELVALVPTVPHTGQFHPGGE